MGHEAFQRLDLLQSVRRQNGSAMRLTRSPLRINGARATIAMAAPSIGAHSAAIRGEFNL